MCGRYASIKAPADLADEFHAVDATEGVEPDYNVAPTKNIVAVVERHPRDEEGNPDPDTVERSLRVVRWGLVPYWAKDPKGGARMINARSESAAEKPAFRRALAARRCLIPADGWYEWQRGEDHKQPYFTHYADGRSLAMAGLWEYWKPKDDPNGEYPDGLVTAAVLTAAAVGPLRQMHDRMPLVLPAEAWDTWLNPDADAEADAVAALLAPPSAELVASLELRPVSPLVNSVRNNGPELLRRTITPRRCSSTCSVDAIRGGSRAVAGEPLRRAAAGWHCCDWVGAGPPCCDWAAAGWHCCDWVGAGPPCCDRLQRGGTAATGLEQGHPAATGLEQGHPAATSCGRVTLLRYG